MSDTSDLIKSDLEKGGDVDSFCDKLIQHCNPKNDNCPAMKLLYAIRHYSIVCRDITSINILHSSEGFTILRTILSPSEIVFHNNAGNSIYNLPFEC